MKTSHSHPQMTAIAKAEEGIEDAAAEEVPQSGDRRRRRLLADGGGKEGGSGGKSGGGGSSKKEGGGGSGGGGKQKSSGKGGGGAAAAAGGRGKAERPTAAPAPALQLAPQCRVLLELAEPPALPSPFETAGGAVRAAVAQLEKLQATTGLPVLEKDAHGTSMGVSLTGWSALVGLAALVVAVLGGAAYGLRALRGGGRGYALVAKGER